MEAVKSKNNVPIRLPRERWLHITEEHSELAGYYFEVLETVKEPEAIYKGSSGENISIREVGDGKYIVVIYKEINKDDGFIITSFLTRRAKQFKRRKKIWP